MSIENGIASTSTPSDVTVSIKIDPKTGAIRRAIKDAQQAFNISKRILNDNRERLLRDAAITRKLNDEQPYNPAKLKAAGESWRHNRSTGFMSSLMRRVIAPYKQAIDSAKYLTSSKLEDDSPEGQNKTMIFREEITRTVRQWQGWHDFSYQFCFENCSYGHAAIIWTDSFDWRGIFARCDQALFPDGVGQVCEDVPLFMFRQQFMVHELTEKIQDTEAAESAGWNIQNVIWSINNAQNYNQKNRTTGDERMFEDTIRDTTVGVSYSTGTKIVDTYHLFVKEGTGTVSHYLVRAEDGKPLMERLDEFDSMSECLALFVLEIGNGKLQGSKGGGRILFNTHVGIEQSRNLYADTLYISSLIWLRATSEKGKNKVAIQVTHPFGVIPEGYDVADAKAAMNSEAYLELDRHMSQLAELQMGTIMPGQILDSAGSKRTASEINYIASVEQQIKDAMLVRFWGQFLKMIFTMQKRICSKENIVLAQKTFNEMKAKGVQKIYSARVIAMMKGMNPNQTYVEAPEVFDSDGFQCCLRMFQRGLTANDIIELSNCPPNEITEDRTAQDAAAIDLVVARYLGDNTVNQEKLKERDIASKIGATVAKELIIPTDDNTLVANATRMQLLELNAILQGETEMPVSSQDNDVIHMQVIMEKVHELLKSLTPQTVNESSLGIAKEILKHFILHLQAATRKGIKPEELETFKEFGMQASNIIEVAEQAFGKAPINLKPNIPKGNYPALVPPSAGEPPHPKAAAIATGDLPENDLSSVPTPPGRDLPLSKGPQNLQPNVQA